MTSIDGKSSSRVLVADPEGAMSYIRNQKANFGNTHGYQVEVEYLNQPAKVSGSSKRKLYDVLLNSD